MTTKTIEFEGTNYRIISEIDGRGIFYKLQKRFLKFFWKTTNQSRKYKRLKKKWNKLKDDYKK